MSNPKTMLWRTADGQLVSVEDMESTHLINAMAMMRRRVAEFYTKDKGMFDKMGVKDSDMIPPIFKAMARELKRRNFVPEKTRPQGGRKLEL